MQNIKNRPTNIPHHVEQIAAVSHPTMQLITEPQKVDWLGIRLAGVQTAVLPIARKKMIYLSLRQPSDSPICFLQEDLQYAHSHL
ncbi:MAG: hypothetical protein M5U34_10900 [Chloroflexi bacterium]|nr:hypothetical protein [Chloroflexota bacterium]